MQIQAKPAILSVVHGLFFINSGIWLVFALATLVLMTREYPEQLILNVIIGVLMLGNAAAMLLSGWGLIRYPRLAFPFGILVLLVNIPLSVTDEFGVFDLMTMVIDLALLVLMVVNRKQLSGIRLN